MTARRGMAALGALLLLVLTQTGAQTTGDSASVTRFYNEWFAAAQKSPEAYASFYAVDGMVLPPGRPEAVGREAIAAWLRERETGAGFVTRPEGITVDEKRFLTPTIVVQRSTLRGQRIARADGAQTPFETKYLDLLRRSAGGRWEVVYRMWSDNR